MKLFESRQKNNTPHWIVSTCNSLVIVPVCHSTSDQRVFKSHSSWILSTSIKFFFFFFISKSLYECCWQWENTRGALEVQTSTVLKPYFVVVTATLALAVQSQQCSYHIVYGYSIALI